MTIIEDSVVLTVGLLDLVEALRDQERLDAVAGHEGERGFEEIESAERWELVEHEQQPVRSCARVQLLGQAAPDLVEDEPDERLGPARSDERREGKACVSHGRSRGWPCH